MSGVVLVVVLLTKFMHGAGYAIAAMAVLFVLMLRHPQALRPGPRRAARRRGRHRRADAARAGCTRSCWSPRSTSRRCGPSPTPGPPGPSMLEAITVDVDPEETKALQDEWDRRDIPVPLKALDSPYREITRPVSTTSSRCAPAARATSSSSTSPSTSSGTGGSRCCTTRARCGSRPGCSSPPASWSRACRGSWRPRPAAEERVDGPVAGSVRPRRVDRRPSRLRGSAEPRRGRRGRSVEVGPVAHGGHCVARHEGRVVFVRHALPGERVRVAVTEDDAAAGSCARDAVEVLEASPDRVEPPCPYAGPGRCGGCDFQHVDAGAPAGAQGRRWSREQFAPAGPARRRGRRRGGSRATPTGSAGARGSSSPSTRTGAPGLRQHRSHDIVPVDDLPDRRRADRRSGVLQRRTGDGVDAVDVVAPSPAERGRRRGCRPARPTPPTVVEHVEARLRSSRDFEVAARGFWQVHPGAAGTFVQPCSPCAAAPGRDRARPLLRCRPLRRRPRRGRGARGARSSRSSPTRPRRRGRQPRATRRCWPSAPASTRVRGGPRRGRARRLAGQRSRKLRRPLCRWRRPRGARPAAYRRRQGRRRPVAALAPAGHRLRRVRPGGARPRPPRPARRRLRAGRSCGPSTRSR